MYKEIKQKRCKVNGKTYNVQNITCGVPQGSDACTIGLTGPGGL